MSYNTDNTYHRLRNHYRFWRSQNAVEGKDEFFNGLEDLGLCKTVEDFWQIYLSLPIVGTNNASRYYLFKNNIEPTWEHEKNAQGGRVIVSINRKDLAPYLWEVLLLTTIGEQFDVGSEICGVSVTIKRNTCTFMVWNKTATFEQAIHKIEMKLRLVWNAPQHLRMVYKINKVAMEKVTVTDAPVRMVADTTEDGNYKSTNRFAFLSDDDAEEENAENSDSVN